MSAHLERTQRGSWLSSVVAILAIVAAVIVFLWSINDDPQVAATLRASQTTTSEIKAINDGLAIQRRDLKVLFDQLSALTARLSVLQEDTTLILRDSAALAERLKATQTQMAQDNALAAEQFKALTQMVRDNASATAQLRESHEQVDGALARGSEESLEFRPPLPKPRPTLAIARRKLATQPQAKLQR